MFQTVATIRAVRLTEENRDRIIQSFPGVFEHGCVNGEPFLRIVIGTHFFGVVRLGDWIVKSGDPRHFHIFTDSEITEMKAYFGWTID